MAVAAMAVATMMMMMMRCHGAVGACVCARQYFDVLPRLRFLGVGGGVGEGGRGEGTRVACACAVGRGGIRGVGGVGFIEIQRKVELA